MVLSRAGHYAVSRCGVTGENETPHSLPPFSLDTPPFPEVVPLRKCCVTNRQSAQRSLEAGSAPVFAAAPFWRLRVKVGQCGRRLRRRRRRAKGPFQQECGRSRCPSSIPDILISEVPGAYSSMLPWDSRLAMAGSMDLTSPRLLFREWPQFSHITA